MNLNTAQTLGMLFEGWPFSIDETDKAVASLNSVFDGIVWATYVSDSGDYRVVVENPVRDPDDWDFKTENLTLEEAQKVLTVVEILDLDYRKVDSLMLSLKSSFPDFDWGYSTKESGDYAFRVTAK